MIVQGKDGQPVHIASLSDSYDAGAYLRGKVEKKIELVKPMVEEELPSKEAIDDCEMSSGEKLNELLNLNGKTLEAIKTLIEIIQNPVVSQDPILTNTEATGVSKDFIDCLANLRTFKLKGEKPYGRVEASEALPYISSMVHKYICAGDTRYPDSSKCRDICIAMATLNHTSGFRSL